MCANASKLTKSKLTCKRANSPHYKNKREISPRHTHSIPPGLSKTSISARNGLHAKTLKFLLVTRINSKMSRMHFRVRQPLSHQHTALHSPNGLNGFIKKLLHAPVLRCYISLITQYYVVLHICKTKYKFSTTCVHMNILKYMVCALETKTIATG